MTRQPDVVANTPIPSTWGNTIRDRTVVPFTNAAQRTTDWVAPLEGAMSWLSDVDRIEVFNGTAWIAVPSTPYAYTAWTATWTGAGATLGNGASVARYLRIGRQITGSVEVGLGTTSVMATDQLGLMLPTPIFDPGGSMKKLTIGSALFDNNGTIYHGLAYVDLTADTANDRMRLSASIKAAATTWNVLSPVSTTQPWAWTAAATDRFSLTFTYEAAT